MRLLLVLVAARDLFETPVGITIVSMSCIQNSLKSTCDPFLRLSGSGRLKLLAFELLYNTPYQSPLHLNLLIYPSIPHAGSSDY